MMGLLILLVAIVDGPPDIALVVVLTALIGLIGVSFLGLGTWLRSRPRHPVTVYALTDRRVIIRQPVLFGQVQVRSFRAQDLSRTSRIERADGSGMILLEGVGRLPNGVQAPVQLACLAGLEGVRDVEAQIRAALLPD